MAALITTKRSIKGRSAFYSTAPGEPFPAPKDPQDPTQDLLEQQLFHCIGFLFGKFRSIDPEDYFDFCFKTWSRVELLSDLRFEVLPAGMLLHTPSGQLKCVLESKLIPFEAALQRLHGHLLR